jgi:hypothetical protein
MKNVHIIERPTIEILGVTPYGKSESTYQIECFLASRNIHITSNEEIKEGDWVITYNGLLAKVITEFEWHFKNSKKIILTTDQDLIKDGVQSIDDEFLEWFAKNSSCEFVEVANDLKYFNVDELRERHLKGLPYLYSESIGYKIIIPKEELKQEIHTCRYCGCKWQQERMYSEEEVIELLKTFDIKFNAGIVERNKGIKEWFEQFKKK